MSMGSRLNALENAAGGARGRASLSVGYVAGRTAPRRCKSGALWTAGQLVKVEHWEHGAFVRVEEMQPVSRS
jgi:hypothetical protein